MPVMMSTNTKDLSPLKCGWNNRDGEGLAKWKEAQKNKAIQEAKDEAKRQADKGYEEVSKLPCPLECKYGEEGKKNRVKKPRLRWAPTQDADGNWIADAKCNWRYRIKCKKVLKV